MFNVVPNGIVEGNLAASERLKGRGIRAALPFGVRVGSPPQLVNRVISHRRNFIACCLQASPVVFGPNGIGLALRPPAFPSQPQFLRTGIRDHA